VFWKYLGMMIVPIGQSVDHDFQPPGVLIGVSSLVVLLGVAIWMIRNSDAGSMVSFGGLWLLVPLLPSLLIPNSDLFNESRAYFAVAGFGLLVSTFLLVRPSRMSLLAGRIVAFVFLVVVSLQTLVRNPIWNDDVELWAKAAQMYPGKSRVRYNHGSALARVGEIGNAEEEFRQANNLNPQDDLSYAALGYCAEVSGDLEEAGRLFGEALRLNPENRYAQDGLARIKLALGS
jgi:tetratricopeptide (TPR) repeat protein